MSKNSICIIPARSGSKRLKNKNILRLDKKYLIEYSVQSAISSKIFKKIVVSSDSIKVKKILNKYKSVIFHHRSKKLSSDTATVNQVCIEIIKKFNDKKKPFEMICCLYPTSPLRDKDDIRKAFKYIKHKKLDFLIGVTNYLYPFHQALKKKGKYLHPFFKKDVNKKIINDNIYVDSGSMYIGKIKKYLKYKTFYGPKLDGYFLNRKKSIDINYKEDFNLLKYYFFKK